jgi:hypothetical protein
MSKYSFTEITTATERTGKHKETVRLFRMALAKIRAGADVGHFLAVRDAVDGVPFIALSGGHLSVFERLAITGSFLRNTIGIIDEQLRNTDCSPDVRKYLFENLGAAVKAEAEIAAVIGDIEKGAVS